MTDNHLQQIYSLQQSFPRSKPWVFLYVLSLNWDVLSEHLDKEWLEPRLFFFSKICSK